MAITTYTIDISNMRLQNIPINIFANTSKKYFIPLYVYNNLMTKLNLNAFKKYNKERFIERHFKLVEYFISSEETYHTNIRQICGGKHNLGYKIHLEILKDLIISRGIYQKNGQPFNYKIKTAVDNWVLCCFKYTIIRKTINRLDANHPLQNNFFNDTLANANINTLAALNAEYNHCLVEKYDVNRTIKRLNKIFAFEQNDRSIGEGNIVKRVYSSFNTLTSVSRKFVQYDNQYFFELDISNCQPLMLLVILNRENLAYDMAYENDVSNGTFYSNIQQHAAFLNITTESIFDKNEFRLIEFSLQDDIKELVFRSIFFGQKTVKQSPTAKVFADLYPITYQSLMQLKKANLAKLLQDLEAAIILPAIPNCQYYTLHDGIYLLNETEIPGIKNCIMANFNRMAGKKVKINFKTRNLANEVFQVNCPIITASSSTIPHETHNSL